MRHMPGNAKWRILFALAGISGLLVGTGNRLLSRTNMAARVSAAQSHAALYKVTSFDLPGPPGKRFDYLTILSSDHLLLSTHLGAGRLYIVDLESNRVVNTIQDLPGIEAVEAAPDAGKAYTSNWGERKVGIIDLSHMRVIKKLAVENKPDGIAYAVPFRKIYVSDERARAEFVIDVTRDEIVRKIAFNSETGVPRYDPVKREVLVNLQDRNSVAVIDPATDTTVGTYPLDGCQGNHGMALDPEHRRAFLSCEGNDKMMVFNLDSHKPVVALPMAKGADVIAFDPGLHRIYVACGSGAISVFQQDDADHYRKLPDVPVERRVHSLAVDEQTHKVYVPEEQEAGKPVAKMVVYAARVEQ